MNAYRKISERIEVNYKATGKVRYDQIDTKKCKPIIDQIDTVLANHYGFTDEELDFIVNYDIKYRLGRAAGDEWAMILHKPTTLTRKRHNLWSHGNTALFDEPLNAVLYSKACPGEKVLEAIDLAQQWRSENRAVVSGFHIPVEKECLRNFLRGPQHIVICPARGVDPFQLPADWQPKFKRGELLIVSPFNSSIRRPTKETAESSHAPRPRSSHWTYYHLRHA
jgi:hypothetical protein